MTNPLTNPHADPHSGTVTLPRKPSAAPVALPLAVGALVAVGLGVYGRLHTPTNFAIGLAGFSGTLTMKTWLTTAAFVLAIVQLVSALIMYGKLPGLVAPPWIGTLHRWSGRLAFLATIPVAFHCLYALGMSFDAPRVIVHSLTGCFFYGAFVAKMVSLPRRGLPGWALPLLGGLVFTGLVVLWLTSSLWFFTTFGFQF